MFEGHSFTVEHLSERNTGFASEHGAFLINNLKSNQSRIKQFQDSQTSRLNTFSPSVLLLFVMVASISLPAPYPHWPTNQH